jgi:tRNA-splicing ligase RtcB
MPQHLTDKVINWASVLERNTAEQAKLTGTMPFIHPHVALMPDAHLGKGATVGSVIPTLGAIMPAAVGVDIGCGMRAVRTNLRRGDLPDDLQPLRVAIERRIPLSAGKYNSGPHSADTTARVEELAARAAKEDFDPDRYAGNWRLQLGSLGSGNHFIEVSLDRNDQVWLFLHSGSRGVGNKIAQHHIKVAQKLMTQYWIKLPDPDLAYLVEGTDEFWAYIREMRWAQEFAYLNRTEMMARVEEVLTEAVPGWVAEQTIDCHHNYTERERHFGKEVWLSRKGAINAEEGAWGLIPGSMGSRSYVVQGKGNRVALNSAPHGAGRNYSRSAARKAFTQDDLRAAMAGIEYRDTDAFIDEIPAAYKDIEQVMADADDLVQVRYELRQIVNVKGD